MFQLLQFLLIVFKGMSISVCSITASVGVDLTQEKRMEKMGVPNNVFTGSERIEPMPFIA